MEKIIHFHLVLKYIYRVTINIEEIWINSSILFLVWEEVY